jgi:tRNA U34 2-thiouridine synthase MnmA/TrmU
LEDKNYRKFINKLLPEERGPGPIIHIESTKVVGTHQGIHSYTIGQRKGLGVSSLEPLYVVKIDTHSNTVYVGPKDAAKMKEFIVEEVNWLAKSADERKCTSAKGKSFLDVTSRPHFRRLLSRFLCEQGPCARTERGLTTGIWWSGGSIS